MIVDFVVFMMCGACVSEPHSCCDHRVFGAGDFKGAVLNLGF